MFLVSNNSTRSNLLSVLKEVISRSREADIAVAFLSENGALALRDLVRKGHMRPSSVTLTVGTSFNLTAPAGLRVLLNAGVGLRRYIGKGAYHPKLYWFATNKGDEFILGSANLSQGALTSNVEAAIHHCEEPGSSFAQDVRRFLDDVKKKSHPWTNSEICAYEGKWQPNVATEDDGEMTATESLRKDDIYQPLPPRLTVKGKVFAFTGQFRDIRQAECMRQTKKRGGQIHNKNVTRDTDILVVGSRGNPNYSCGNYGRKIEKAYQYREDTERPYIFTEDQWWSLLAR